MWQYHFDLHIPEIRMVGQEVDYIFNNPGYIDQAHLG